jgi:hypothetical protein
MADRLGLFQDRPVSLKVPSLVVYGERRVFGELLGIGPLAAGFQEIAGQVEILGVARQTIKLGQADLDFLMAGVTVPAARAEDGNQQVGILEGDLQKSFLAGSLKIGCRRLLQMADVVQLMA